MTGNKENPNAFYRNSHAVGGLVTPIITPSSFFN